MKVDYSFIITIKNRQKLLDRCLESVLWQDYADYEAVVVDYGSDPKIAVPDDQQIRIVRLEPEDDLWNGCVALNAGIANARADKLVLLNCDCIVAPDMLSSADAIMRSSNRQLQIYWRRFNLTPAGLQFLEKLSLFELFSLKGYFKEICPPFLVVLGLGRWHVLFDPPVKPRFKRVYDLLVAFGLHQRHVLTSYGDFLAVEKAPLMEIGGFDERMTGWGRMDIDMMERLKCLGCQEFWGRQFKLIHQFHVPQGTQSAKRNTEIHLRELAMGNIVRNGGIQNFEKYRC